MTHDSFTALPAECPECGARLDVTATCPDCGWTKDD